MSTDRSSNYSVPKQEVRAEIEVQRSRFLAILTPVSTLSEAQDFLVETRKEFARATHVCWAWSLGGEGNVRCSDDGEPAGTAGRPMLAVLTGAGVSDTAVAVVRWFGGTKLGRGGLVRAYTAAVRRVLDGAELFEHQVTETIEVKVPYSQWQRLLSALGPAVTVEFSEQVSATFEFVAEEVEGALSTARELGAEATCSAPTTQAD